MIKIYGKNCTYEAIFSGHKLECVYTTAEQTKKDSNFISLLQDKKIKYQIVDKKKMDSLFGISHQNYGAFASDYQYYDLDTALLQKSDKREIFLVLDGIEDPHNFGAILRSADAFGVKGVIIPKNRSVSVTEVVAHVSTGAIEYVPIIMVNNLTQAIVKLKENGYWIVGAEAKESVDYRQVDYNGKIALVVGSEGYGISRLVLENCDYKVRLPMVGKITSLNVSVASALLLYQIYNSRNPL